MRIRQRSDQPRRVFKDYDLFDESDFTSATKIQSTLRQLMDGSERIHFNLEGLDPERYARWARVFESDGRLWGPNVTNWELYTVSHNDALWSRTTLFGSDENVAAFRKVLGK